MPDLPGLTPLRVVVADDEPLIRTDLVQLLAGLPRVTVVGAAAHGAEALDLVERTAPDALFLDVQMPGVDGFGVVAELDPATAPAIVFVTAFDQYAVQAFDAQAVDYLLKPFDPPRLARAVARLRQRLGTRTAATTAEAREAALAASRATGPLRRLAARGVGRTVLLDTSEIQWIEAADNYVRLHTAHGVHLSRRTMRDLELQLDPQRFVRIHRSTIVALDQVRELRPLGDGDQSVILRDGTRLVLTRSYRATFEARVGGIA